MLEIQDSAGDSGTRSLLPPLWSLNSSTGRSLLAFRVGLVMRSLVGSASSDEGFLLRGEFVLVVTALLYPAPVVNSFFVASREPGVGDRSLLGRLPGVFFTDLGVGGLTEIREKCDELGSANDGTAQNTYALGEPWDIKVVDLTLKCFALFHFRSDFFLERISNFYYSSRKERFEF